MSDQTTADVLESAADYIEKYGWHQGSSYPRKADGSVPQGKDAYGLPACAVGAWAAVTDGQPEMPEEFYAEIGDVSVSTWNDDPDRTEQEVLDAFRKAAKRALGAAS